MYFETASILILNLNVLTPKNNKLIFKKPFDAKTRV